MCGGFDSVGTLLADIANLLSDGLRILSLADKRHWGPDEHEQVRALEQALDEAKKDFQELAPLVNGQFNYERDRKHESIEELRALRSRFDAHVYNLKDWGRSGGPINPVWVRDTHALQRDLHRAQRRAARRIFTSDQESSRRCLGAFLVHRVQRRTTTYPAAGSNRPRRGGSGSGSSSSSGGGKATTLLVTATPTTRDSADSQTLQLEELAMCARVGGFERFGEDDVAFICDFCDGHLVWEDLESVPTSRAASGGCSSPVTRSSTTTTTIDTSNTTNNNNNNHLHNQSWEAAGVTMSGGHVKPVVYPPLAVANHAPPSTPGDWLARVLCPYCEEEARRPQHEDDDGDAFKPDDYEFDDVAALQEHLEWQHPVPGGLSAAGAGAATASIPSASSCLIM
ncbi:hypothetical protein JDV02_004897 [Purpureocillium takamizusanense]|uniref:Uncharacterized protein n=1 Tax=Purpureocillium takamizusanense TaxID=2060973 RepID=A0A9Q8QG54_9HYPO|nr:uncharacterized protein JDV02_004897 [Purpureocillium takamizusanense]UNI18642.1 hypothetical protein JDV02_004897 [Purpureocillium takamizusanense]